MVLTSVTLSLPLFTMWAATESYSIHFPSQDPEKPRISPPQHLIKENKLSFNTDYSYGSEDSAKEPSADIPTSANTLLGDRSAFQSMTESADRDVDAVLGIEMKQLGLGVAK
ncbi:hypothetical protein M501DRAFT_453569 [Patellaria atrata CBS 101060]|uniref:Uncharacterized protein n=1 Tax=Patellaria atrata CBS 101060 TaxID=1346257 RepID=A0A9P4S3D9_9PEZI|nr:hypothetical protein M501DRAFT_453569 [Patellaria atrata CBS 101060]